MKGLTKKVTFLTTGALLAIPMFKLIQNTIGLRVSPEEETEGLDYGEHAACAYPDFQVASRI